MKTMKEFRNDQQTMERFLVRRLGDGLHEFPGLLSGSNVAVRIQDDGCDPDFGDLYDIEILPKDLSEGIPLEWIVDYVIYTRGIKSHLPGATKEEYESLKASIARFGVQHPIHLDELGRIIDGEQRKKICDELGIKCPRVVISKLDAIRKQELATELNTCRKHLGLPHRRAWAKRRLREMPTDSDRTIGRAAGLDHKTIAKIRKSMETNGEIVSVEQRRGGDGKKYPFPSVACKTTREVGKAIGLLHTLGIACPNREIPLRLGCRMIRRHRRDKLGKSFREPDRSINDDIQILHGDFRKLVIPDNSVNLVFTDPPYPEEFVDLYGELSKFAARVLKPGGLLLAYSGVRYLDRVISLLGRHLDYHWQNVLIHTSCGQADHDRKTFCSYKPILCFSKGKGTPLEYVQDVFMVGNFVREVNQPFQPFKNGIGFVRK